MHAVTSSFATERWPSVPDDTRTKDMIWMRPQSTPREPRQPLSREKITEAAVRLADTQGIDAVSMRGIATELGCGTMSLYRHVRTKDEVHDLMVDHVMAEEGDWG